MTDLRELDRLIEGKIARLQERGRLQHDHGLQRMHAYEERRRQYTTIADRLAREVIRPRLEKLAGHFDNAVLQGCDQAGRHQCVCCFSHTDRFPATVKLEFGVSRDGDFHNVVILYNLSILPVYFSFDGQGQLALPLDRVNDEQVASWIEKRVLAFLDIYFRLETVDQYQEENLARDPVCGMRVNRLYAAAQFEYQGHTYYFCVPECREKFSRAPEEYLKLTPGDEAGADAGTLTR
jgi:YHS domain-containing protein